MLTSLVCTSTMNSASLHFGERDYLASPSESLVQQSRGCGSKMDRKHNEKALDTLHPLAAERFRNLINDVEAELGIKLIITDGYRSYDDQMALWSINRDRRDRETPWLGLRRHRRWLVGSGALPVHEWRGHPSEMGRLYQGNKDIMTGAATPEWKGSVGPPEPVKK